MLEGQDIGKQVLQLYFIALIGILADCWLHGGSHCPIPFFQVMRKASTAQAECWNPYSYAGQAHGHVTKPMSLSVSDR